MSCRSSIKFIHGNVYLPLTQFKLNKLQQFIDENTAEKVKAHERLDLAEAEFRSWKEKNGIQPENELFLMDILAVLMSLLYVLAV